MPTNLIRVVLADDHAVVRKGIREFLTDPGDIDVIAEASDGEEAIALIDQLRPDVAVVDIQMPKRSGIDVCRHVRAQHWPIGLLVLTAYDDEPYVLAVLQAGANGYVLKTADADDIVQAVRDVHIVAREFLGDFHVVVARHAKCAFAAHGHGQLDAINDARPAINEVAQENYAPSLRVAINALAKFVARRQVAKPVEQLFKFIKAAVHIADNVEGACEFRFSLRQPFARDGGVRGHFFAVEQADAMKAFFIERLEAPAQ